jgi:DNA polymerase-3 subunit alpha (Gram-positive type)
MAGLKYYIIDTETTGLSADYHEIIEISIIRAEDKHQITKFIKPDFPQRASPEALKITNKSFKDLLKGEAKEAVVESINKFLAEDSSSPEHRVFVAHNAPFDRRFCHALWSSVNKIFPANSWLDTKSLAKSVLIKQGNSKPKDLTLKGAMEQIGAKAYEGAHNALIDSRNCYLLWKKAMDSNINYLTHIKRSPHSVDNNYGNDED